MTAYKVEICGVNTSKLPLLSANEKEELLKRAKDGDKAAREKSRLTKMRNKMEETN